MKSNQIKSNQNNLYCKEIDKNFQQIIQRQVFCNRQTLREPIDSAKSKLPNFSTINYNNARNSAKMGDRNGIVDKNKKNGVDYE